MISLVKSLIMMWYLISEIYRRHLQYSPCHHLQELQCCQSQTGPCHVECDPQHRSPQCPQFQTGLMHLQSWLHLPNKAVEQLLTNNLSLNITLAEFHEATKLNTSLAQLSSGLFYFTMAYCYPYLLSTQVGVC